MQVDQGLVQAVERYAGSQVHDLRALLQVYKNTVALANQTRRGVMWQRRALLCEMALRAVLSGRAMDVTAARKMFSVKE